MSPKLLQVQLKKAIKTQLAARQNYYQSKKRTELGKTDTFLYWT